MKDYDQTVWFLADCTQFLSCCWTEATLATEIKKASPYLWVGDEGRTNGGATACRCFLCQTQRNERRGSFVFMLLLLTCVLNLFPLAVHSVVSVSLKTDLKLHLEPNNRAACACFYRIDLTSTRYLNEGFKLGLEVVYEVNSIFFFLGFVWEKIRV